MDAKTPLPNRKSLRETDNTLFSLNILAGISFMILYLYQNINLHK